MKRAKAWLPVVCAAWVLFAALLSLVLAPCFAAAETGAADAVTVTEVASAAAKTKSLPPACRDGGETYSAHQRRDCGKSEHAHAGYADTLQSGGTGADRGLRGPTWAATFFLGDQRQGLLKTRAGQSYTALTFSCPRPGGDARRSIHRVTPRW